MKKKSCFIKNNSSYRLKFLTCSIQKCGLMKFNQLLPITILLALVSYSSKGQFTFQPNDSVIVIRNSDTLDIPWAGGFNAPQFSRIDLNLDGKEDLIAFDRSDRQVIPLLNMGDSNEIKYKYAPIYKQRFPESRGWMLARDFNNDGKKDIFFNPLGGDVGLTENSSSSSLNFSLVTKQLISNQYPGGNIGIYVPSEDIPAIYDVNGDGDLDIITFGVLGTSLEYHKNFSIENTGNADTNIYNLKNYCWGHFLEVGINTNKLILFDTCNYNVPSPELGVNPTGTGSRPYGSGSRHVGSTVTAFDNNGDSVVDLLLGDVTFNNIVMALSGGTLPDQNSSIIQQDTAFPSYDTAVNVKLFPATYIEDVDNDGLNDLIVAPNTTELAENYNQIWYYKNEGTNKAPIFRFKKKTLFEDEVIDLGDRAIPELFDYNTDGLLDLVVSNYGYFNRDSITYECKISLYENKGTALNPVFEFITGDYQNIFSLNLGTSLHPTFGDIDNDGDQDMILGNSEGYLHLFTNTAGAGNTASFTLTSSRLLSNLGDTIDVGQFSAPQLFDYDNDNDLDLIIGRVNGWVSYYENIGTPSAYNFKRYTDSLGRVEIHEAWDIYGAITGYSTPQFYRNGSSVEMYCGSQSGGIYKFTGINPANPRQTFIIDTVLRNYNYGNYSVPVVYDFKNDGKLDIISGNNKGGLNFFTEKLGFLSVDEIEKPVNFKLYPNPTSESVTIQLDELNERNQLLRVIDITGKLVMQTSVNNVSTNIDVSSLGKGVYFVTLFSDKGQKTRKLVVQ